MSTCSSARGCEDQLVVEFLKDTITQGGANRKKQWKTNDETNVQHISGANIQQAEISPYPWHSGYLPTTKAAVTSVLPDNKGDPSGTEEEGCLMLSLPKRAALAGAGVPQVTPYRPQSPETTSAEPN